VPIQQYTVTLLENLAGVSGYPAGFAAKVTANVVSREDNVGAIVAKVGLGEGDAGVVYVTDAKASDTVATVDIPAEANVIATYGGVVVRASTRQEAAATFLAWLAGPDGGAILSSFGFLPAP
jgi:molybdate transport system substrate-binding protein